MNERLRPKPREKEPSHLKKVTNEVLLRLKVRLNPNYFKPNQKRVYAHLMLDREMSTGSPDFMIPLGSNDSMRYVGKEEGCVNDRPLGLYQDHLFREEFHWENPFQVYTPDVALIESVRKPDAHSVFGGYQEAFKAGRVVLDIGSGQALAILQLAQQFPETTFIGLDRLYAEKRVVFPEKNGVQLTNGDWRAMTAIPDNSVDTILSLQGIGMWGLPKSNNDVTEQDGQRIIRELHRISKPGTIVRIDGFEETLKYLQSNFSPDIWEVETVEDRVFVARKKK